MSADLAIPDPDGDGGRADALVAAWLATKEKPAHPGLPTLGPSGLTGSPGTACDAYLASLRELSGCFG